MNSQSRPATTEEDANVVDVLVADDDVSLRESLLEWLGQEGLLGIGASNGAEALRLAGERTPRMVLLDLEMPVSSGWQFLEHRRKDRDLATVPVVVISTLSSAASGRYDVAAHFDKPIDERRLLEFIRMLLSARRSHAQATA